MTDAANSYVGTGRWAAAAERPVLCIGLDVTWWGGSAREPDSRYDCLACVTIRPDRGGAPLRLKRVSLAHVRAENPSRTSPNFDPAAGVLTTALGEVVLRADEDVRIVLAVDAPLQVAPALNLPPRPKCPRKGEKGRVARRRCEDALDAVASGPWRPRIQPGAPLSPRVVALVEKLRGQGFALYGEPGWSDSPRVVIECFPAEAMWACAALRVYDTARPGDARAYKSTKGKRLKRREYSKLARDALAGARHCVGVAPTAWDRWVDDLVAFLASDEVWLDGDGRGRGGKLFDDAVDAVLSLSAAVSFASGPAHVWADPVSPAYGHIIGPGMPDGIGRQGEAESDG